jgi:adenylate cyclase
MRVERCFAFLDLCGFTAYTQDHGDDAAVALLAQLRAIVRAEAEHEGVRVTKWLGDGVMLSGIQRERLVACAGDVRDRLDHQGPLELRGGISGGPVIMFEGDDYIGAPVNVAARLCALARPGQILLTADVAAALQGSRTTAALPAVLVPGLTEPVEVCELDAS